MTPFQYQVYKDVLASFWSPLQEKGMSRKRAAMRHAAFAALATLRKVCNHPDLVLLQQKQRLADQQLLLEPTQTHKKRKRMQQLLRQQQEDGAGTSILSHSQFGSPTRYIPPHLYLVAPAANDALVDYVLCMRLA